MNSWQEFSDLLTGLSKIPGKKGGKGSSPLITPAWYKEGTTRSNLNVEFWGKWAAIDVDEHNFTAEGLEDDLLDMFGRWNYVCYSTASSRIDKPKFRVVFPTTRIIEVHEIRHFWFALQSSVDSIGDRQCKDFSRMYYVPAKYPDAFDFMYYNTCGVDLDPDDLMSQHEFVQLSRGNSFLDLLPEDLQKEVIENRKTQLVNTDIHWLGYQNCPFFPKKLAIQYKMTSEGGWYHLMYLMMVAIASNAIKRNYPITPDQIVDLCREFDIDNGNWYEKRPMNVEANSALNYAYRKGKI